jgi:N4-gp56 family major capsid protein
MQGKSKGDVFHWNVFSDISTQGTTLTETKTMPESQYTITQGTLTITEMGNSVPYTAKLNDLSLQPVKEIINKVLKNDAKKAFDIAAHAQFNDCKLRVVAQGGTSTTGVTLTTNGTATTTNNVAFNKEHVGAIVDTMKERNIPAFAKDDYYCLSHPSTFRTMKNDLETVHQYTTEGFGMIMNGEMGRYEGVRFVEQTHIPKGGAADASTFEPNTNTAEAWDNAKSSWMFFIGEDTVAEAIAVPEEMRGKIPTDFGRSKGVAWYYLGGFGLIHTQAAQSRIIKWDSAS